MDPTTLLAAGIGFIGSTIAQKCADAVLVAAWARITYAFRSASGRELVPQDLAARTDPEMGLPTDRYLVAEAELAFTHTSALRRAKLVAAALKSAALLWVDDRPANNEWEVATFKALGIEVTQAIGTEEALTCLKAQRFDVILSDIARGNSNSEGIKTLASIAEYTPGVPVVFYVGSIDLERGVPRGAFGLTNRPDELLHLVMDALERRRL